MNRFFFISILSLIISGAPVTQVFAAETSSLNTQDNALTLSSVRATDTGTVFNNVILRISSFGTVTMDDARVGSSIEYNPITNTLFLPSVMVGSTNYSKVSLTGLSFDVLSVNGVSTAISTLNTQDNSLTLSSIRVSDSGAVFKNVVIRLTSFGTVTVDDPRVSYSIEYNPTSNTLFLPSVTVGNTTYSKVSLSGLAFGVVSVDGIVIDSGTSGQFGLDLVISASGVTSPPIHINNVPKPNTQGEFCSEDVYAQFKQSVQGFSGSWQVTSCSFDGTTGLINALLNVTSPISMSMPYSVRYTYVAQ